MKTVASDIAWEAECFSMDVEWMLETEAFDEEETE